MKSFIKRVIRSFGYELRRYTPLFDSEAQLIRSLDYQDVDLVVDVGANEGQFGLKLIEAGYSGDIISVEPLSLAYEVLKRNAQNIAIG